MIGAWWREKVAAACAALLLVLCTAAFAQSSGGDEAIHNELRALRTRAVEAVNRRDAEALLAEMTDDVVFTAMNNEVVRGRADARAYYDRMLGGAARVIEDMRITVEPDALSVLHNNGESAISTGNSEAYFKIRGGLEFTAPLRWTAGLVREGGAWKIASMHFSANVFQNPVDAGIRRYLWLMLVVAGAAGLLIGGVLGLVLGRRRRPV